MKKILFQALVLASLFPVSLAYGGGAYLSGYLAGDNPAAEVKINGSYAWIAAAYSGHRLFDISDPFSVSLTDTLDVCPSPLESRGVDVDPGGVTGFYASRAGAAAYTNTYTYRFEDDYDDMCSGSDEWDTASCSPGNSISAVSSFPGPAIYDGSNVVKMSVSGGGDAAWLRHTTASGTSVEMIFWMYLPFDTLDATEGQYQRIAPCGIGTAETVRLLVVNHIADQDFELRLQTQQDSGAYSTATGNVTDLQYDTWYQIKVELDVNGDDGGARHFYRTKYGAAWTNLNSSGGIDGIDNSTKTPTDIMLGPKYGTITAQDFYFDEYIINVYTSGETWGEDYEDDGRMSIVEISTPAVATEAGNISFEGKGSGIYYEYPYVYVGAQNKGLWIFDVSDNGNPVWMGRADETDGMSGLGVPHDSHGMDKSGNYIFHTSNDGGYLRIVDVSDPSNPFHVAELDCPETDGQPWDVEIVNNVAFVSVKTSGTIEDQPTTKPNGIWSVDISDPLNPVTLQYLDLPVLEKYNWYAPSGDPPPQMFSIDNGYAYIANGTLGVAVADIRDPIDMKWDTFLRPKDRANNPFFRGADASDGLVVGVSHGPGAGSEGSYQAYAHWPDDNCYVNEPGSGNGVGFNLSNQMSLSNVTGYITGVTPSYVEATTGPSIVKFNAMENMIGGKFDFPALTSDNLSGNTFAALQGGIWRRLLLVDQSYWSLLHCVAERGIQVTATGVSVFNVSAPNEDIDADEHTFVINTIASSMDIAAGKTVQGHDNIFQKVLSGAGSYSERSGSSTFYDTSPGWSGVSDYRLKKGSVAINAGTPDRDQDGLPDIGYTDARGRRVPDGRRYPLATYPYQYYP